LTAQTVPIAPAAAPRLDRHALAQAYDQHAATVFRLLRRLGVSESAAADALQDVFVVAWRKHQEFEGRSSPRTWLCGIALRVARDYRRERDRRLREHGDVELPADSPSPEAQAAHAAALRRLDTLLAQMSEPLRECFVLVEIEQLQAPEVAELLRVPVNTVYSRVRLARAAVLEQMSAEGGEHRG
jgi:RNA polymerase sigma-70 factor (ECF subfamily)